MTTRYEYGDSRNDPRAPRRPGTGSRPAPATPPGVSAATLDRDYADAYRAWLALGENAPRSARERLLQVSDWESEYRDLSLTSAAGGYTVPPQLLDRITAGLLRASAMARSCNVVPMASAEPLSWPAVDDTAVVGERLTEAATIGASVDVTFGARALGGYMYSSKLIKASFQLVRDATRAFEPWLAAALGARIGRIVNAELTNGTGGGTQPAGLIPNVTVGKQGAAGSTVTIKYDDLIDLIHSVDPEYRELPPDSGLLGFQMSDTALKMVRKAQEASGKEIITEGIPLLVLGYPTRVNNSIPVPAASAKTIVFGNFHAGFLARSVPADTILLRLEERYGDTLTVGFIAFQRWDAVIDDPRALRAWQQSAT